MFCFQAAPWAATVTDHVKSLSIDVSATRAQETRAIKVEFDLKSALDLIEVMTGQADAITMDWDGLQDKVK